MDKKDGGAAFPFKGFHVPLQWHPGMVITEDCVGLTKREWFAGMALQGLLAAESEEQGVFLDIYVDGDGKWVSFEKKDDPGVRLKKTRYQCVAEESFKMADSMLSESDK